MTKNIPSLQVAAIVDSVPKPPEMVEAEACLRTLQGKEAESVEAARAPYAELQRVIQRSCFVSAERLAELENHRLNLSTCIARLRTEQSKFRHTIDKHRPAYALAVTAALLPTRRQAAERVIAAVAELQSAAAILDQSAAEIERAGGAASNLMGPLFLGALAASAQEIIGETDAPSGKRAA